GAERGERDHAVARWDEVPALEQRLQRPAERAARERQPLRGDAREHRRRPRRRAAERLEQIEPKERGREAGGRRTQHRVASWMWSNGLFDPPLPYVLRSEPAAFGATDGGAPTTQGFPPRVGARPSSRPAWPCSSTA